MIRDIFGALIGAAIGGLIGYLGKCSGSGWIITSSPWTGALVGAVLGIFLARWVSEDSKYQTFFDEIKKTQDFNTWDFDLLYTSYFLKLWFSDLTHLYNISDRNSHRSRPWKVPHIRKCFSNSLIFTFSRIFSKISQKLFPVILTFFFRIGKMYPNCGSKILNKEVLRESSKMVVEWVDGRSFPNMFRCWCSLRVGHSRSGSWLEHLGQQLV